MEEDLVDDTCPVCGNEYDSRKGVNRHIEQSDCDVNDDSSRTIFTSKKQIHEQIAEDSSFDYKTVKRLISVASIPEQFQAFVKIPEIHTLNTSCGG